MVDIIVTTIVIILVTIYITKQALFNPEVDKMKKKLKIDDENYQKGITFEKFIINKFDKKWFALHDWTRDLSGKFDGVIVESDANPDIVMRYKPNDEKIAIEAKFRSNLYKGKLNWASKAKLIGYKTYAKKTKIPTFIVIGLGGTPDNPERIFCIPIEEIKYPAMYPSQYIKYERSNENNFFWRDGILK